MAKLVKNGSLTQALARLQGTELPDVAEQERRRSRERDLRGKPVTLWPQFDVAWDLDPVNFHKSRDGKSAEDFRALYPAGIILSDVPLSELDAALHENSRRTAQDIWSEGDPDKAARAIRHWEDRHAMTPPLVDEAPDGTITLAGGNHRLAVARAKGETSVPILFDAARLGFMQGKLPSLAVKGIFRF